VAGLIGPGARKSIEPMAARTAPEHGASPLAQLSKQTVGAGLVEPANLVA
jgi:hypothetical protein